MKTIIFILGFIIGVACSPLLGGLSTKLQKIQHKIVVKVQNTIK